MAGGQEPAYRRGSGTVRPTLGAHGRPAEGVLQLLGIGLFRGLHDDFRPSSSRAAELEEGPSRAWRREAWRCGGFYLFEGPREERSASFAPSTSKDHRLVALFPRVRPCRGSIGPSSPEPTSGRAHLPTRRECRALTIISNFALSAGADQI